MVDITGGFFNLQDIIINEVVGDVLLALVLLLLVIAFLSLKRQVPFPAMFLLLFLAVAIFYANYQITPLWFMALLITGLAIWYPIAIAMKR